MKSTKKSGCLQPDFLLLKMSISDMAFNGIYDNIHPVVITKENRIKYFKFLKNNDGIGLAKWLNILSTEEKERMGSFGYKEN